MLLAGALLACAPAPEDEAARGAGDPCIPESVPADGFSPGEVFLETSHVGCATLLCMVDQRDATGPLDPSLSREECLERGLADCDAQPTEEAIAARAYCTCRCSAAEPGELELCACPSGYSCADDLVELGGPGIRGGYCVRGGAGAP
ncbi:MAG: hypothetical protein CMN29_11270 [Sandaracinus sp.]|nr:hypothetical protein [Myxococcales bacterium]MAT25525.1 hypothetical protein [Sandaracinus sp.]